MKKGERKGLNMVVELVAHVGDHPTANEGRQLRLDEIHDAPNREYADDRERQNEQYGFVSIGENVVEYFLREVSHRPVRSTVKQHANHGQNKLWPDIGSEIFKQP